MDKEMSYRKKAEYCRQQAEGAKDPQSSELWRQLAANYENMARQVEIYSKLV